MDLNKIEDRKDFYAKGINTERTYEVMKLLVTKCSLDEILWIIRNIAHDQVAYWDDEDKGIIYKGDYTNLNREQATHLQRQLSVICDLFGQSIINKTNFNQDYLNQYDFAGNYLRIIESQKEKLDKLKETINELSSQVN